jgi:hypothetical protein
MLNIRLRLMASSGLLSFTEAVLMYFPLQENGTAPEAMCRSGQSLTGCLNAKNDFNAQNLHDYPIKNSS